MYTTSHIPEPRKTVFDTKLRQNPTFLVDEGCLSASNTVKRLTNIADVFGWDASAQRAFSSQSWQFYGIDEKNCFLRSRMARNRSWPALKFAQYVGTSFSRQVNHKKLSDSHTDQNEIEDQYSQPVSVPGQFDADSSLGRTISNCRYRFEMTIWVSVGVNRRLKKNQITQNSPLSLPVFCGEQTVACLADWAFGAASWLRPCACK